jgi:molybdate transport system ATP-binding protein
MIDIAITKELDGAKGSMALSFKVTIKQGEFVALSGKSGSGKTTLLRILAGLEKAQGEICVADKIWLNSTTFYPPQKREIGFVFQDYALFENMTIEQNLLFVAKDTQLAQHLLEVTELSSMKHRYPHALSGGQKQRVAICRALMKRPKLLLLDEPLSALDSTMRTKLQNELLALHKEFQTTTIMVSHDSSEIYKLASRMVVLENGAIIQDAPPSEVLLEQKNNTLTLRAKLLCIQETATQPQAIVTLGQQLTAITITKEEAQHLSIGEDLLINAKELTLQAL